MYSLSPCTSPARPTGQLRGFFVLVAICLSLASCGRPEQSLENVLELHAVQAKTFLRSGQYRAAGIEANNLIQKAPDQADGYVLLARIFNELGRFKDSLEVLDRSPAESRNSWAHVKQQLIALQGRGKFKSARALLEQHSHYQQQHFVAFVTLSAKTDTGLGKFDSARQQYSQIASHFEGATGSDAHSQRAEALVGLARLAANAGALSEAETLLNEAEALDPESINAGILRAQIALSQNNLEAAENHLTNTLLNLKDTDTLTPRRANVLQMLADALIKQGRSAEALAYTQILAESFPGYDIAQEEYLRANKLYHEGSRDEAESILEKIVEDYPGYENAAVMLAIIKFEKQDYTSAASLFNPNIDPELAGGGITQVAALANLRTNQPEKVLAMLKASIPTSNNSQLLAIYGGAALSTGKMELAFESLQRALRHDRNNIIAMTVLASYHLQQNPAEHDKALALLREAIELEPENIELINNLVRALLAAGRQADAKAIVAQTLKTHRENTDSLLLAGDFSLATGDVSRANEYYQKAMAQDAENYNVAIRVAELTARTSQDSAQIQSTYLRAINIDPENLFAYKRAISVCHARQEIPDCEKKLVDFARDSGHGQAYALFAVYYAQNRQSEKALHHLAALSSSNAPAGLVDSSTRDVNYLIALQYLQSKNLQRAKDSAFAALKADPTSSKLIALLTEIETASGDLKEAMRLAEQLKATEPSLGAYLQGNIASAKKAWQQSIDYYREAWGTQATEATGERLFALLEKHKPELAQDFLDDWLSQLPESPKANALVARDHLMSQNYEQAIPLLQKVRKLKPDDAASLNNLAWALDQTGDSSAAAIAKEAHLLQPNNPSILDTYGWILYRQGDYHAAEELLHRAAQLAPEDSVIAEHLSTIQSDRP